ncbi:MAG: hypothetical protein N3G80_00250 [Candidatus Micrarchaeota archaeon]|nr:hypothetical protein [Candidatus Micrarchaeota archaeon]
MAKNEALAEEETKLRRLFDEAEKKLLEGMDGKPYLIVLVGLHEIERENDKSKLAAQWEWRSNIRIDYDRMTAQQTEVAKKLASFAVQQLEEVINHPEAGIKKKYGIS